MALVIQGHYRLGPPPGSVTPDRVLTGVTLTGTLEVDPAQVAAIFGPDVGCFYSTLPVAGTLPDVIHCIVTRPAPPT